MWKACWNCLSGRPLLNDTRDDYNQVNLINGARQRKALWPPARNMFHLPKELSHGDNITISGEIAQNRNSFVLILCTDESDEIFKFIADFNTNKINIIVTNNGQETYTEIEDYDARGIFPESQFTFRMKVLSSYEGNFVNVSISDAPVDLVKVHHNLQDITHIVLRGDIDKVHSISFEFA